MVLQQQDNVAIWGKDAPDSSIKIISSWGNEAKAIADKNGFWRTTIKTKKASFDKHTINIQGSSSVLINNILIGEVWFCSGQSNMEMPMKGLGKSKVLNSDFYLEKANNNQIRLFNNSRSATVTPSFELNGNWVESNAESATDFSAIGYIFGTKLRQNLNVPIGIIESAWGGTKIETWIPKEELMTYPSIKFSEKLPEEQNKQKKPSFLYNAMIHPFQNFTVKGILWYQGESDRNDPEPYKDYMEDLINSWRKQWRDKKLPFYFVQIAPYAYDQHRKTPKLKADLIREAQLQVSQEIDNTGMVVTTDAGDCDDIHPSKKEIVAERLANWALAEQYDRKLSYKSPEFKTMSTSGNQVILTFKFFNDDFFIENNNVNGFEIAGLDKIFHPAKVTFNTDGKRITLISENVDKPIAVRYGFEDCFESNLKTQSGLPLSIFRTDK